MSRPRYDELLGRTDAPAGSSWGLFPDRPERGMANLAGPDAVRAGAAVVRRGVSFGLDFPLDAFDPPLSAHRTLPEHVLTSSHRDQRDDRLDGFWLQISSQLDGLRHRRHHEHGFYAGVPDEDVVVGSPVLGVQRWAEHPLVGRGVVVDVERHRLARGRPIDHEAGEHLDVALLDETLAAQGALVRPGDFVLLRTGWAPWYRSLPDRDARARVRDAGRYTGLDQSRDTLAWLWDHGVALAASDTVALEAIPPRPDSPYGHPTDPGLMHQELLGLLGLPVGELWDLDALAADCAVTGGWECLLVSVPLHLVGGVGSPSNAVAIR